MDEGVSKDTVSFSDLGIKVTGVTKSTWLGKIRSIYSLSKLEIAFLCISLLSLMSALGITIYRLVTLTDKGSADFTFGLVLVLNILFCTYYILNGIFFERPYEIGVLVLATGLLWLYLVLNYAISVKGVFKLSRLVVSSVLSPCVIVIGVLIACSYNESKSLIFRTVGAQTELQDSCSTMFIFFGLLKADLQISFSLALLILTSPRHVDLVEEVLLSLMLIFGISSALSGYMSVRYENKVMIIIYAVLLIVMPSFATYMIVEAAKDLQSSNKSLMETSLYAVIFVVAAGSWVVRVVSLYFGIKVYLNFGKGLKQKVFGVETELSSITAQADDV